jgi:hypothetical protein
MYGLVHQALEEHVLRRWGDVAWTEIKRRAGVADDVFLTHEPYPDEVTGALITAAAATLGVPTAQILEGFGEHWLLVTAQRSYGALLATTGSTLPEFLVNLPNLHTRVTLVFPRLRPPEFRVSDVTASSLRLTYASHREGLAPFVVGILRGLGQLFGQALTIAHVARREDGADDDVFAISWEPAAGSA